MPYSLFIVEDEVKNNGCNHDGKEVSEEVWVLIVTEFSSIVNLYGKFLLVPNNILIKLCWSNFLSGLIKTCIVNGNL